MSAAIAPGLSASFRYSANCAFVVTPPPAGCAHSTCSASRPCFAAQKCFAITATPLGTSTTFSTPAIYTPAVASNLTSFAPNAGARRTTAVRKPGNWTSLPNCAVPEIFSGESIRRTRVPINNHNDSNNNNTNTNNNNNNTTNTNTPNNTDLPFH